MEEKKEHLTQSIYEMAAIFLLKGIKWDKLIPVKRSILMAKYDDQSQLPKKLEVCYTDQDGERHCAPLLMQEEMSFEETYISLKKEILQKVDSQKIEERKKEHGKDRTDANTPVSAAAECQQRQDNQGTV